MDGENNGSKPELNMDDLGGWSYPPTQRVANPLNIDGWEDETRWASSFQGG